MVPKISPARESARSCFQYDIAKKHGQPRGEWIAGTLCGTPRQMAKMAGAYRALRQDCRKPVWRCSLSLPPSDGRPSPEKWADIAQDFLREMGIPADAAWCAVHHGEVEHDHIHITLLRTLPDGTLWNESRLAKRAIKACAVLEAHHQLASHDRTPKPKNAPTRAEIEIFNRQQKKGQPIMSREHIQSAVDQILLDYPPPKGIDFVDLQRLLAEMKPPIDLQVSMPKGVFRGVSYQFDSFKWPGSKIGREYSVGLVERGVRMPTIKTGAVQPPPEVDPFLTQQTPPAALKRTLPTRPPQHQLARVSAPPAEPETSVKKMGFDLDQIADLHIGPLSKVMLYVGGVVANLSFAALRLIFDFIRKILARFGFGMRPAQPFANAPAAQAQLMHEPFLIEAEARQVTQSDVDEAARQVFLVAEAVTQNDPNLLPAGEGRSELIEALTEANSTGQATVSFETAPEIIGSEKTELDELFSAEADDLNEPVIDKLEALKSAIKAQSQAEIAVETAPKVEAPEVAAARQSLVRASQKLRDARAQYQSERHEKPKLLQFAFPAEKDALSREIAAEAAAETALTELIAKHPSKTPTELISSLARARLQTGEIAKMVAAEALKSASLNVDPEVKKLAVSRANSLIAQAELFVKFPTLTQANIVLSSAESSQILVAAKQSDMTDLARREVQRALQSSDPQNRDSDDAPR